MERTEPFDADALLRRILTEPSRAHTLLTALAAHLEADQPFQTMTHWTLCDAMNHAIAATLTGTPGIVATEATMAATAALPEFLPGETAGEYALRVRAAARGL